MRTFLDLHTHPVIAHRGASGLAPENTREALQLAVTQGADALEFDVHLAADGVPVLMHDPNLDRTTTGSGLLRTRTAEELGGLDAGYHFTLDRGGSFPWRGRGLGIPTLTEVLESFPRVPLLIELKTVEVAEPVRRLILARNAVDRVAIASFLEAALVPFRTGGFQIGASRRSNLTLWWRAKLGLPAPAGLVGFYAVPYRYRDRITVPTPRFIAAARRAGRPVHVWTVDDPERAVRLWRLGVSGIITNHPAELLEVRNRLYPEEALRNS